MSHDKNRSSNVDVSVTIATRKKTILENEKKTRLLFTETFTVLAFSFIYHLLSTSLLMEIHHHY